MSFGTIYFACCTIIVHEKTNAMVYTIIHMSVSMNGNLLFHLLKEKVILSGLIKNMLKENNIPRRTCYRKDVSFGTHYIES